jgi:ATP-binding cassette, subfamily B, bacterial PglK
MQKKAQYLLAMTVVMAILEIVGIFSIMPFIAVLTNPTLIETNSLLNYAFKFLNNFGLVENEPDFIIFLGIIFFLLLITSLSLKAITIYFQSWFAMMSEYYISKRLAEVYFNQPYNWFLNRNSADLGRNILSEVSLIVNQAVRSMINLLTGVIVIILTSLLLFLVDPKLAILVYSLFGMIYFIIYKYNQSFLRRIGNERFKNNEKRFSVISDSFKSIKVIKVKNLEKIFLEKFSKPAKVFAENQISADAVSQLPRFAVEGFIFGGGMLLIIYLISIKGNFINAIPYIAVFAFAGYRLMPAIQQVYVSVTLLKYSKPAVDSIYVEFQNSNNSNFEKKRTFLKFNKEIKLNNINYKYPNSSKKLLKNINISIPAKSTFGLVGVNGSGKTTLVDIILGLLEPQKGTLQVDGKIIEKENLSSWQKIVGYVPQQIFLSDDTIQSNIAFGVDTNVIDYEKIEKAAKIAKLHDFVINELPNQYQTIIGEGGQKLSGGQRQRIGIARALYHDPQVLILDESTNALDNLTEQKVNESLNSLKKHLTVILITHRLNDLKNFDKICLLENGEIKAQGNFQELLVNSESFKNLANKNF